jgi:hypothetical protein
VFADVEQIGGSGRVLRIFRGAGFTPPRLAEGRYPPHPAFYVNTEMARTAGGFEDKFKIAGDFDLMIRLFNAQKTRWHYVPQTIVTMRMGGVSTRGFASYRLICRELAEACRDRGLKPNLAAIYGRLGRKLVEVVKGAASGRRGQDAASPQQQNASTQG